MIIDDVNDFICTEDYELTYVRYDANAIKIRLCINEDRQAYLFYVCSPWRVIRNNGIVNSSGLYPFEEFYDSKEKYREDFSRYCESTRNLEKLKVVRVELNPVTNDLKVLWEDGTFLENFCIDQEATYYIYDDIKHASHDIGFNFWESTFQKDSPV